MNFVQRIYYFFTPYVNTDERRVAKFFGRVREQKRPQRTEKVLTNLLQQHAATINLWTERAYKNYDYLTKKTRRELYDNLAAIEQDFAAYESKYAPDSTQVLQRISALGIDTSQIRANVDEVTYMAAIMHYLSPQSGRYEYRESSSFGRLLQDPTAGKRLIGDCNQIVTLYVQLFALRYPVEHLQLSLLPEHVALHLHGVDIEATSGQFAAYNKDVRSAPIYELVSVNLLDVTDTNFTKSEVNPEAMLQASRLAYMISSDQKIVQHNLEAAYTQVVNHTMKLCKYKKALEYARQSKNQELVWAAAHNGALYEMKQGNYKQARNFAASASKKTELLQAIDQREAGQLFNSKSYDQARKLYERMGDKEMVKRCYRGLYIQAQNKLSGVRTVADLKAQSGTVRDMERYARASGDKGLIKHAANLVKQL